MVSSAQNVGIYAMVAIGVADSRHLLAFMNQFSKVDEFASKGDGECFCTGGTKRFQRSNAKIPIISMGCEDPMLGIEL